MTESRFEKARRIFASEPDVRQSDVAKRVGLTPQSASIAKHQVERRRDKRAQYAHALTLPPDVALACEYVVAHGCSVRLANCVQNEAHCMSEPFTLAHARDLTDAEWLRVPNFGRMALAELRAIIGPSTYGDDEDKHVRWDAFQHWAAV